MQFGAIVGLLLAATAHGISKKHPIEGVIDLLDELTGLIKKQGEKETETYHKFESWCKESKSTLDKAISKGKGNIASLEDEVSSLKEEEATLGDKISFLAEEIKKNDVSGKTAEDERDAANKLYEEREKDYKKTIDAIKEAIEALKSAESDTALMQVKKSVWKVLEAPLVLEEVSAEQRALIQKASNDPMLKDIVKVGHAAKHVKKYDFKSGNVIDLLGQLQEKFVDDREEATKTETADANSYEKARGARDEAVDAAKSAKEEKETALGDTQSDLAEAKGSLKTAKDDLEADEKSLTDTSTNCKEKASEWDERCKLREHEAKAMVKAKEILKDVASVRTETPENKALPTGPVDLQLKSLSFFQSVDPKMRAVNLIRQNALKTHSKVLERFADQVQAHLSGPFDVVNQDIQKMIFRLMAEQKDEDDHKNWCDLEIQKSEDSKEHKEEKNEKLKTKIDDDKATSEDLGVDIEDAEKMVEKITKHMKEAKEIRNEGHKENMEVIKDSQSAQAAIAKAEAVLTEFYKSSGEIPKEPWEFLQREPVELPENPSTWDASYTGVKDPNKKETGILAILQACSGDFAKTEAETRANEMEDKTAYDEDMQSSDIEKARRSKETEMKTQEKQVLNDKVNMMMKLRQKVNTQLEAVEQYLKDLKPACVDGDSTYEDRKKARADEIEALKKAQGILKDAFKEEFIQRPRAFLTPIHRSM